MSTRLRHAIVLPTVVALCATLVACDMFTSVEERVRRAQSQFDSGNYSLAMQEAKLAIEKESGNATAHVVLARVSLRLGDPATAAREIDRAREAGAKAELLQPLHYQVLFAQKRYEQVLEDVAKDSVSPPLRRFVASAQAYSALNREGEAGEAIEKALSIDSNDSEALLARAQWLQATGRPDEARAVVSRVLEAHPDSVPAAMFRARLALNAGDAKSAVADYDVARKHALKQLDVPAQLNLVAAHAEAQIEAGDIDAADANLNAIQGRVAKTPDDFITYFAMLKARVSLARREYSLAVDLLRIAKLRTPENIPARLLLGATLLQQGSLEQANQELSEIISQHPENIDARKLLAKVYVARNDLAGAQRILDQIPDTAARDPQIDWLGGAIRLMTGQTDEAIALLEASAKASPNNSALQLDLAQAYLSAGRGADAAKVLRAIPASQRGARGSRLLVLADISGKDPAQARQALDRVIAESPKDSDLLVAGGLYLVQAGDAAEAGKLFQRAIDADPKNTQARFGIAATALQKGESAAAESELRKIIAADRTSERAYLGLSSISLAKNDRAGARKALEQAISANPSVVESRLRLAALAFADKNVTQGEGLLDQALSVTTTRPLTLRQIGTVLMGAQRYEGALDKFNEAASLGVKPARIDAANALLKLGRRSQARDMLESAVRESPAAPEPAALLVRLEIEDKRYEPALARVAALEKAGGAPVAVAALRAQTLEGAGKRLEALQAYERLAKLQPSGQAVVKMYTMRQSLRTPEAEAVLVDWLQTHDRDLLVRVTLAQHYQAEGNRTGAITQYERAVQLANRPELLNNLAWLYFETNDPRALDRARAAYTSAPGNAQIADTYGWILLSQGRADEALKILETAARAEPSLPDVQYHYATALARAGRKQEAATMLRRLLAETRAFPARREAETLLDSLT